MARTPIHPGEILRDELDEIGINAKKLAEALHVPPNRVSQIINGRRAITADTALRLSRFFGTAPAFWMNLQQSYDLRLAAKDSSKNIRDIKPWKGAAA
jgi:addiction module HigA family antidote